ILVTAPRIPRSVSLSIFSSSLNPRERVADNRHWPPLGWRARVGQDDRLEASATVKGLRDPLLPIAGLGIPPAGGRTARPANGPLRGRWCWRSDVVQHRPCRTIRGLLFTTRSRHRPTISLFTEDIAMTHAVLVLALSVSGQSQQAWPAAQGPGKVLPQAQAPSKIAPAPQAPAKIAPAPQAPAKIAPAPQAPA